MPSLPKPPPARAFAASTPLPPARRGRRADAAARLAGIDARLAALEAKARARASPPAPAEAEAGPAEAHSKNFFSSPISDGYPLGAVGSEGLAPLLDLDLLDWREREVRNFTGNFTRSRAPSSCPSLYHPLYCIPGP